MRPFFLLALVCAIPLVCWWGGVLAWGWPVPAVAGGAKAVMGYVNNVYSVYSRSMLWATVNRMIEGETLEQAVDYAKSIYGTDDIIWYNEQGGRRSHAAASYAMLSGDRSAALPNPYTAADVDAAA